MSAEWPVNIKSTVDRAAMRKALRRPCDGRELGLLSMAGEVFACVALIASAVCTHLVVRFQSVVAICDCSAAANAIPYR